MKRKSETKLQATDTRDAVETAIDLSKGNQKSTWDGLVAKRPGKKWSPSQLELTREEFEEILKRVSVPTQGQPEKEKSGT